MDIQLVFNEYKAVTYMCSYFCKSEDQCSQAMQQAAKEAFENNTGQYQLMKTITRAYLSKRMFCTGGSISSAARIKPKKGVPSSAIC